MDFEATRAVVDKLPSWIERFVSLLPEPERQFESDGFQWEHTTKSAELVQVTKAVRIGSAEITFLGEGLLEGRLTREQQQFVDQHFSRLPLTPDVEPIGLTTTN